MKYHAYILLENVFLIAYKNDKKGEGYQFDFDTDRSKTNLTNLCQKTPNQIDEHQLKNQYENRILSYTNTSQNSGCHL